VIEAGQVAAKRGIFVFAGVHQLFAAPLDVARSLGVVAERIGAGTDLVGDIALLAQDSDGAPFGLEFLAALARQETIGEVVVLDAAVGLKRSVGAMVVGGDESLARDKGGRAAAEVDGGAQESACTL